MKKSILLLSAFAILGSSAIAQKKTKKVVKSAEKVKVVTPAEKPTPAPAPAPAPVTPIPNNPVPAPVAPVQQTTVNQNADLSMKFTTEEHNFGNIPEGPAVTYDFEFKNIGKEPIILSGVQASCGCTTPTWTKEPVAPGKVGKVSATYNTQGRPGNFVKTITINSNVGTKVVKITGVVEKAPETSVPANNNSMMKH